MLFCSFEECSLSFSNIGRFTTRTWRLVNNIWFTKLVQLIFHISEKWYFCDRITTNKINFLISGASQERKYNCLLIKSNAENGIQSNPNNIVWNLRSRNLANEKYDVLSYGLNHGLATNLSCDDVLPSMKSVWAQLTRDNLLKGNYHSINRAKNCLRALNFNLIDLDNQKVFKDKRKVQVINELRKDTVILKPD